MLALFSCFSCTLFDMDSPQRKALWQALGMAWELGYTIAVPLVIFALAGRWADGRFHTKPWLFLAGVVLAIIATSILLVRKFTRIIREFNTPKPQ